MSIAKVARLAGVSTSTVSRVINAHPNVAPTTVQSVKEAIKHLGFAPTPRRTWRGEGNGNGKSTGTIGFVVLGTDGSTPAPAFLRLLQGVTGAAEEHHLDLNFSFVTDLDQLPRKIASLRLDGLLLHGQLPAVAVQQQLQEMPSVWLMANPQRPTWGDQVMPENIVVGELAASYLTGRGHKRLAYLGVGSNGWFIGVRTLAFTHAAAEAEAEAIILTAPDGPSNGLWRGQVIPESGEVLVNQLLQIGERPSGLFVAEDRLLPAVYASLGRHGISIGAGKDVEIISCNYEQPHLLNLTPTPASIDIRPEAIGRCGVERLLWRMRNPDCRQRVRIMLDPALVEPPPSHLTNQSEEKV